MPDRATLESFAALVEAGDYVGAIERYYAPDAATRENGAAPLGGRDALVAKEQGVMAAYRTIEAKRLGPIMIEGDHAAIAWRFTFTTRDGATRTMEEIAWQTWRGAQLVEERFFYDPKQMAK